MSTLLNLAKGDANCKQRTRQLSKVALCDHKQLDTHLQTFGS
jgi:hypothetical protein